MSLILLTSRTSLSNLFALIAFEVTNYDFISTSFEQAFLSLTLIKLSIAALALLL